MFALIRLVFVLVKREEKYVITLSPCTLERLMYTLLTTFKPDFELALNAANKELSLMASGSEFQLSHPLTDQVFCAKEVFLGWKSGKCF